MRRRSGRAPARISLILSGTLLLVLVLCTSPLWAQRPSATGSGGAHVIVDAFDEAL